MTAEREKAINEWLGIHCPKCANNADKGTDFLNCQAECEVQKKMWELLVFIMRNMWQKVRNK